MIRRLLAAAALAVGLASPVLAQQQFSGVSLFDLRGQPFGNTVNPFVIQAFRPAQGATVVLTVGPTATPAGTLPLAASGTFQAGSVTSFRVRNATTSASPITFVLTTSNTATATLPTAYSTSGTGGTVGDVTIDPNNTEYFGLTAAQQAALAAGTLYLSAVAPGGGSGTLTITLGNGS